MHKNPTPRRLMAALGLAALALLAGGAWFYRAQERALRQEAEANLTAIAELKVQQVAQWRAERLGDAAVLTESPFFSAGVARWLAAPLADDTDKILTLFRSLQEHYGYADVLLSDAEGQVRLSLSGYLGPLPGDAAQALFAALAEHRPVLGDLHPGPGYLPPRMEAVAPFFAGNAEGSEPLGAVILQSDAQQFLYPLIQSWPVPSDSAETLLVRRDGDHVLFLNNLRFRPGTALTLRFPLSQTEAPAVMAVLGQEGAVQGVDYRGVEVLSAHKAVPDSPWLLVAKVDAAEALSAVRRESILVLALLLGLVLITAVGVAGLWQHNAKAQYRALYEAETAGRKAEQRYRVTLMSVGDGVIATDAEGRVELLNPVAEALTGWPHAEAREKPLSEVFRTVHEETHRPVEDPARRVLREGIVVGLGNHRLLIARDGTERPIADAAAPIRGEQGEVDGVVLVFRDQTAERAAQRALRESVERYQAIARNLPNGIVLILDRGFHYLYGDGEGLREAGWTSEALVGKTIFDVLGPDLAEWFAAHYRRVLAGETVRFEYDLNSRSYLAHAAPLRDGAGGVNQILVLSVNITKRKQAEEALKEYSERMEEMVEERTQELREAQERLSRREKLAALGELAGTVSHELRNPLGAIANAAYFLRMALAEGEPDPEVEEAVAILGTEVARSERIISELLDFGRTRPPTLRTVDLNDVVLAALSRAKIPGNVEVVRRLDESPPIVRADPDQLDQVLVNLIHNAVQAMPEGGRLVVKTWGVSPGPAESKEAAVSIADTGVGIPAENLEKLFEPLFTTKARGMGLGLAIVRTLVEGHGGAIEVESQVGEGSTFTVRLPVDQGA